MRHRPGRRGDHDDAHVHGDRRGRALPWRRRQAGRHRPGDAVHRSEPGRGRHHRQDEGGDPGPLRRPGGRHGGDRRHRAAPRPARDRGRGACAAGHQRRPPGRHARLRRDRVQLLRQQDDHHRRRRHGRDARRDDGGADADDAPARHEPRRLRSLHGQGAELVLRDRRARASSTT